MGAVAIVSSEPSFAWGIGSLQAASRPGVLKGGPVAVTDEKEVELAAVESGFLNIERALAYEYS